MMLRTTVLGLALTLTACSSEAPTGVRGEMTSSTAGTPAGTPVPAAPLDAKQVIGAWRVVSAEPGAPFGAGDQVTFLQDRTFLSDGATDGGGAWSVVMNAVLLIHFRGERWGYGAHQGSIAELRLDGANMSLTRIQ